MPRCGQQAHVWDEGPPIPLAACKAGAKRELASGRKTLGSKRLARVSGKTANMAAILGSRTERLSIGCPSAKPPGATSLCREG